MEHSTSHFSSRKTQRNILIAFFLNFCFSVIEFFGGVLTNSISIISDAIHDLSDALSLAIAYFLERVSLRDASKSFNFGYKRFSVLSAVLVSVFLIVGTIFVFVESVERFRFPVTPNSVGMIYLSVLGLCVNGYSAWKMSSKGSIGQRSIYLHLLEDVLGWGSVLLVSVVMYFFDFPILDPILSISISCWILYNAFLNLKEAFFILLQGAPAINTEELLSFLKLIDGVREVLSFKVWTLNGQEHVAVICVRVSPDVNLSIVQQGIKLQCLKYNIVETTVETIY